MLPCVVSQPHCIAEMGFEPTSLGYEPNCLPLATPQGIIYTTPCNCSRLFHVKHLVRRLVTFVFIEVGEIGGIYISLYPHVQGGSRVGSLAFAC